MDYLSWTLRWFLRHVCWRKAWPQVSHTYGFSPVWMYSWWRSVFREAKLSGQWRQVKGLSFRCTARTWASSSNRRANCRPQCSQGSFSLECISMCCSSMNFLAIRRPQTWHSCGRIASWPASPAECCCRVWYLSVYLEWNSFWQGSQK